MGYSTPRTTPTVIQTARGLVDGRPLGVLTVTDFGAVGDGETDDTAAIQAAIDAAQAAGGGVVYFPSLHFVVLGQLTFTNDGHATNPTQAPVVLTGGGGTQTYSGASRAPTGAILDLRFEGDDARILTLGRGILEISRLNLINGAEDGATPFVKSTQTALRIHDCSFYGSPGRTGTACAEDAIVLGGTVAASSNTSDSGFQGYGTVIENNFFHRIRRAVHAQTWVNSVVIARNTIESDCGSSLTNGAAIEFTPPTGFANSNVIRDNLIEVVSYAHGVKFDGTCRYNVVQGNGFWDAGDAYVSDVYLGADAKYNLITLDGEGSRTVTDNSTFPNPVWSVIGGTLQLKAQVLRVAGQNSSSSPLSIVGPPTPVAPYLEIVKNDGTSKLWYVDGGGTLRTDPASFGTTLPMQVLNNTAGSATAEFRNQFRTGVKFGLSEHVHFLNGAGSTQAVLKVGNGSPEGSLTANVGSLYLRLDGGAGTTLYVKESGTGNTGWVAK